MFLLSNNFLESKYVYDLVVKQKLITIIRN